MMKGESPHALSDTIESVNTITQGMSAVIRAFNGSNDAAVKEYLGDILTAGSFARHDTLTAEGTPYSKALPNKKLPNYVKMMDKMHVLTRYGIEKRAGIQLDQARLTPETKSLLQEISHNIKEYQLAIKNLGEKSGEEFIDDSMRANDQAVQASIKESEDLCEKLRKSELNTAHTIPLIVNNVAMDVSNAGQLGSAVFLFKTATSHLDDANQLPRPLRDYLQKELGFTTKIPRTMREKYSINSVTAKAYDEAYAGLLSGMVEAMHTGQHELQMLNLVRNRGFMIVKMGYSEEYKTDMSEFIPAMLRVAGIKEDFPKALKTPREAELVRITLISRLQQEHTPMARALRKAAIARGGNDAETVKLLSALSSIDTNKDSLLNRQIDLLRDYAQTSHRFTDTAKRPRGKRAL